MQETVTYNGDHLPEVEIDGDARLICHMRLAQEWPLYNERSWRVVEEHGHLDVPISFYKSAEVQKKEAEEKKKAALKKTVKVLGVSALGYGLLSALVWIDRTCVFAGK